MRSLLLCEGACQSWLHIRCAGSSPAVFAAVSASSEPFLCFACHITSQSKEISTLTSELSSLKSKLNSLHVSLSSPSASAPISFTDPQVSHSQLAPSPPVHPLIKSHLLASMVRHSPERKYNIIMFGIFKFHQGSSHHTRWESELDRAPAVISDVE